MRPQDMTQLNGSRALLQAFLADAERYLEEFMGALAPPAGAGSQATPDAALEALRGIRIGAEFLAIAPLAELCRQQEQALAAALPGRLHEGVRDALELAGKKIGTQLAALAGRRDSLAAVVGEEAPAPERVELDLVSRTIVAELGPGPVAEPMEAVGQGEATRGADVPVPDRMSGTPTAAQDPQGEGRRTFGQEVPTDGPAQAMPVADMFQEWLREWRAFRAQIEHLYLGAHPSGPAQSTDVRDVMQAGDGESPEANSGMPGGADVEASPVPRMQGAELPEAEPVAVLKLSIGNTLFALPAANVLGFVEPTRDVASLSTCKALAAVNGSAVPVLDVRERWDLGERPADARIVLVESDQVRIGLWADRVHGTESLRIQPLLPATFYPSELRGAALGAQGELLLLLRPESLAGLGGGA